MQFELKVVRNRQDFSVLSLEAASEADALQQAKAQGYAVLSVRGASGVNALISSRKLKFPLILFSQELLALLEAGLGLVEAMEALAEKEHRPEARKVLDSVMGYLHEGKPFSTAIEQFPGVFPALYVALVRASEKTGDMAQALSRYVAYESQADAVRKKLVSASIYPALLILVGGLVMMFLMGYVVPKFSAIYENSHAELPWLSQLLLAWGRLLQAYRLPVFGAFFGLLGGVGYAFSRPWVRQWAIARLWNIPAIGERMRIYQLARFYRTLGMLLRGGIPVVTGINMVASLLQPSLRSHLLQAEQEVREGLPISQAMENHNMTTPVALRILRVGERTGQMGEMMERIGGFYDDEIARTVEWFSRLFEPLLMVVIGLVIGVIVTLMYMPIFELAGSIQ